MADAKLVPVFMPALVAILMAAEEKKGSLLTETEVIRIRDQCPCMMMEVGAVAELAESRGYDDINPERCWDEWQRVRQELNDEQP